MIGSLYNTILFFNLGLVLAKPQSKGGNTAATGFQKIGSGVDKAIDSTAVLVGGKDTALGEIIGSFQLEFVSSIWWSKICIKYRKHGSSSFLHTFNCVCLTA